MKVTIGTPGLEYRVTATLDSTVYVARLRDDVIAREATVNNLANSVTAMEAAITVTRDETQTLKDTTQTLRDDTITLKSDTQAILDNTQAISDQAIAAQSAADTSLDQANTAVTQANTAITEAEGQASIATTKAGEAATSATSAETSATAANLSETAASTSANDAATHATNAAASETNAATSATGASASATTASTRAADAETAADNAALSAAVASVKAGEAETASTSAAAFATSAGTSASHAATSETVATAKASEVAVTAASISRTNLIIDPSFENWQQGGGFTVTNNTPLYVSTLLYYEGSSNTTSTALTRVAGHNSPYAVRIQGGHSDSGGDNLGSFVEEMGRLADTVSCSIDIKADALNGATLLFRVRTLDAGGVVQSTIDTPVTVESGSAWQRISAANIDTTSMTKPADGHWYAGLVITYDTSVDIFLDNFKVEPGETVTGFILPDTATETARIERYFEKSYNMETLPGTNLPDIQNDWSPEMHGFYTGVTGYKLYVTLFKARKRATPALVTYDNNGNPGKIEIWGNNLEGSSVTPDDVTVFETGAMVFKKNDNPMTGGIRLAWVADARF